MNFFDTVKEAQKTLQSLEAQGTFDFGKYGLKAYPTTFETQTTAMMLSVKGGPHYEIDSAVARKFAQWILNVFEEPEECGP